MSKIIESEESKQWVTTFEMAVDTAGDYFVRAAIVRFPFLGLPIIKQIFTFIIKNTISKIESEGELMIRFKFIDKDVDERNHEYTKVINELKQINENGATEDEKRIALQNAKDRLRNLIRFPVK
jgi:hypothetical protein